MSLYNFIFYGLYFAFFSLNILYSYYPIIHLYADQWLKKKDGWKLGLQMPETIKLRGRTKRLIEKTKSGQKVPSLEAVEVFLVQCNSWQSILRKVWNVIRFYI